MTLSSLQSLTNIHKFKQAKSIMFEDKVKNVPYYSPFLEIKRSDCSLVDLKGSQKC